MNKQKLVELLKQPAGIDAKNLGEIESLLEQNPYFHSGHALAAIGKKRLKSKDAQKQLIKAAIYATNRVNLKKYIEAALGGSQATTNEDAVVKKPAKSAPPVQKPKSTAAASKSATKETPPPATKKGDESKSTSTITRPSSLDLDKILENIKAEYKQLEVNMKNFDEAEKSLSTFEASEAKSTGTKKTTARKTSAKKTVAKKAAPKKPTAKKPTASKASTRKTTTKAATSSTTTKKSPTKATTTSRKKPAPKPISSASPSSEAKKKEQEKLIEQFIKAEPKIAPKKKAADGEEQLVDLSSNQVLTDDMVTETLANIMAKQGRFEKAIEIYNKLIWKFPHKKAYFAGRIKELKEQ